jgi:hypothetical protein
MKILVTGSAGHLGEALVRSLEDSDHEAIGLDIKSSRFTRREGSITERSFVKRCMQGVDVVLHAATLHKPPSVVSRHAPCYESEYRRRGWSMLPAIDRVYVNQLARAQLGWQPRYDFGLAIDRLRAGGEFRSPLARAVGSKGYHAGIFSEGPYPT